MGKKSQKYSVYLMANGVKINILPYNHYKGSKFSIEDIITLIGGAVEETKLDSDEFILITKKDPLEKDKINPYGEVFNKPIKGNALLIYKEHINY